MIQLSQICKIHRSDDVETTALDNIDLHVQAGIFLSILGSSGCGKSTLLNVIGLLDSPNSGSYLLAGMRDGRILSSVHAEAA
jgi:putative ABC transport system ATP-binding protein